MYMNKIDYHNHTKLSGDNALEMEDLVKLAVSKGFKEICITEHVDFNPTDICYGHFDWTTHKENIDRVNFLHPDIKIKCGAEIDYQVQYSESIKNIISTCNFDYIMGSSHYVDNMVVFHHDDYFENKDEVKAYSRYFETELDMIKTGLFDATAHFDIIKRWGVRFYGKFEPQKYFFIIEECLKEIIKRDMTIEINTSGLREDPKEFYPHIDIIRLYKDLGGKYITVGSDTHKLEHFGFSIENIYKEIYNVGFRHLTTYSKRDKKLISIC